MLKFQIRNYDEFRDIFGTRCSSRGCIVNKVLLSFWKHRFKIDGDGRASQIRNMQQLYLLVNDNLRTRTSPATRASRLSIRLGGFRFEAWSTTMDKCSKGFVDFRNPKNVVVLDKSHQNKICSMGAGKFFRRILNENNARLNESVITYCSEEFQRLWEAETRKLTSDFELHVNQHFDYIYDQRLLEGYFGSCMVGKGRYSFYNNFVKASAAYLTKKGGSKIYARCIVYHDVLDSEGNKHNYAERQYSSDGQEVLKTILILKLIDAGIIDIYKTIGAGCREITSIMKADGTPMKQPHLRTRCNIRNGCAKSFLDTFRYLSEDGWLSNFHRGLPYTEMDHVHSPYIGPSMPTFEFDRSDVPII